jgi:hypothetical protein
MLTIPAQNINAPGNHHFVEGFMTQPDWRAAEWRLKRKEQQPRNLRRD